NPVSGVDERGNVGRPRNQGVELGAGQHAAEGRRDADRRVVGQVRRGKAGRVHPVVVDAKGEADRVQPVCSGQVAAVGGNLRFDPQQLVNVVVQRPVHHVVQRGGEE